MQNRMRAALTVGLVAAATSAFPYRTLGQSGTQGIVSITVSDSTGAVDPGASLDITAIDTNAVRHSKTTGKGDFNFVGLPIGTYRLAVSHDGYATTQVTTVLVQASQTTAVAVTLNVGATTDTVNVDAIATPLLDTTSNSLGSVIDLKAIESLPLNGRDLTALARLTAGYAGSNGPTGAGQWNGQPLTNQGVNIDGVVGAPSRAKYVGNASASASPRVENIAEMAVQTDQIDLDQGFGRSSMQISYVTRSGTNQFHGRIYDDFQNDGLNANTYALNAAGQRKPKRILNDTGGSLGGPLLKNKLFFFGSFSTRRQPGGNPQTNDYLTSAAQSGNFTYVDLTGKTQTVNVLQLGGKAGLASAVNSQISTQLTAINSSLSSGGTVTTADPNISVINWVTSAPLVYYYPSLKLDYNPTSKLHLYLAGNMTQLTSTGANPPPFPGSAFSNQNSPNFSRSFTLGFGADYSITPSIVNQFKAGYLYAGNKYANGVAPLYASNPEIFWGFDSGGWGTYNMSGQDYATPISNFYPVLNVSDSIAWQKGSHSIKFGGMWNREQDHYWNGPTGFNNINLGLASGDPAISAFSSLPGGSPDNIAEAGQLYAALTGRISSVSGTYSYSQASGTYNQGISQYNLDELQNQEGIFAQDSWRFRKTLTLNYGMRWDFTGADHDLTGAYHSIAASDILGPSAAMFQPGVFGGNTNPTFQNLPQAYNGWYKAPQPQFGFAWNPSGDGPMGRLLGNGDTVVRGGFNLKRFTMPQQYVWNNTSAYGAFFYQNFYLNANNTGTAGTFAPGSLSLTSNIPAVGPIRSNLPFGLAPATYLKTEAQSDFTFLNAINFAGIDRNIPQPYTESWNLGIERKLGRRALEIRYEGNRTLHQWVPINENEVNVFENGFLQQFKNAQANLAASGGASNPKATFKGALPTPIFDAAFAGEPLGAQGHLADYDNGLFSTAIQNGQVGSVASTLSGISGTVPYFCNLVGQAFKPCATNAGFTGAGAGYATNYFVANPYAIGNAGGNSTSLMKAVGYSNYNSLQVDFRQQSWKGWTFDANYTLGKTLGVGSTADYTGGASNLYTLRNFSKGYGPVPYDIRHTMHFTTTYDLPFGKGKMFLNNNGVVSRLVGNWTLGSIMIAQSGAPVRLNGGNATFNDYGDGGINLTGVTTKDLQNAVHVTRVPGSATSLFLDPKYLASANGAGGANRTYISANATPGTIGQIVYLHGPHAFYNDLSASKAFPLFRSLQMRIQGEFLNVWNHPVFGSTAGSFSGNASGTYASTVTSSSFARVAVTNTPRQIELRANIEF